MKTHTQAWRSRQLQTWDGWTSVLWFIAVSTRLEQAEDILRSLASCLGNGGYNAPDPIDLHEFELKIRDGIEANERVLLKINECKLPHVNTNMAPQESPIIFNKNGTVTIK